MANLDGAFRTTQMLFLLSNHVKALITLQGHSNIIQKLHIFNLK